MTREEFTQTFGSIYEHSRWVPETLYDAGFENGGLKQEGLVAAMAKTVDNAGRDKQLALLCAHPDLAGRLGRQEALTDASKGEQAGAGLDACTEEEFGAFQSLNTKYKDKFGFPFILAVKGWHRTEILKAFKERVTNDPETEFAEALHQVHRIAGFRLEDYFESQENQ
jgi:2-oxo-4-hydroxy-4-carboxy-5-ureidoimidazoline decarboxylase